MVFIPNFEQHTDGRIADNTNIISLITPPHTSQPSHLISDACLEYQKKLDKIMWIWFIDLQSIITFSKKL